MISYILLALLGILLIAADQITKALVYSNISVNSSGISVIDNFLSIVHIHNTGGAWGILSSNTALLAAISIVCAAAILYLYICAKPVFLKLSLILVFSGAIGNMIDRIFRKYVIDFICFYNLFGYEFPSFNVADICVTAGCIGVLIYILFLAKSRESFRKGTLPAKIVAEEKEKAEKEDKKKAQETKKTQNTQEPQKSQDGGASASDGDDANA